jgi:hypothetical protein
MPRTTWHEQYPHDRIDRCTAKNEHGHVCCNPIKRRVWTFWKVWNQKRDGVHRPKCCGCVADAFEQGRRAAA